jgi:hypothetical protein
MGDFNRATRAAKLVQPSMSFVDSSPVQQDLPTTGYLGAISLLLKGTITYSSGTVTQKAYPLAPYGLIRRIRLVTNEGAEVWNTTGWGAYLYNACIRTGLDFGTNHADVNTTGGSDPFSQYYVATGTISDTAAHTFRAFLRLPISWGDMNLTGLLLLQNPNVKFTLEITWGTFTDVWSTASNGTFSNVTITPSVELFHLPADQHDDPDLLFAKTVIEERKDVVSSGGDFVYNPILGNTYNRVIMEFVNNQSTVAPFYSSDITALKASYAQSQVVYNESSDIHLADQRRWYGRDLPSGVFVHDWTMGNGLPEIPSGRDTFDTSEITDMQLAATIVAGSSMGAGSLASGSYARIIKEQLVQIRG